MNEFYIKQIDRLPVLDCYIQDGNGDYVDLSSTTNTFVYKPYFSGVPVTGSATIISATSGYLRYSWGVTDVATPGLYMGEWRTEFSDGRQSTFPNDGFIVFEIQPRII